MTSIYPSSTSSTTSSTSSANLLRISGIASGIDTDSVVKSMVSNYQAKIDKANQAKQIVEWKQAAYRDIIKGIKGLQEYFDPLSSKYMLSGKSLNINTATTDDSSIVSATAGSTAKAGTYKISVSQLAAQAKIEGGSKNSMFNVPNGSEWSGAKLTIGTTDITLDSITDTNSNGTTLDEVVSNINNKISAIPALSGKISVSTDATGSYLKFTNNDTSDINVSATSGGSSLFSNTIATGSAYDYKEDLSKWSGTTLDFGSAGSITLSTISAGTSVNSTSMSNLVADINNKLASSTSLSGKISAAYVNDGTNSYIKFVKSSSTSDSMTLAANATLGTDATTINSGISASSKLISDLGFSAGTISFALNSDTDNVSLTVDSNTTMQNLIDQVKSATGGSITLNVDDTTGKISFQSKNYGSASSVKIKDANDNITTKLGLIGTIAGVTAVGKDAIVSITDPGQSTATITTQSSNQFTVNGVSYNLVGVNNATNTDSNITVTANSDTVVSNVKKFIEDYNTIISTINTKLTEKKNSDYAPLTDAQKESMSETQITAWETKAKVGVLRNDDYLQSLMTKLRGTFSPVYSSYTSASTNTGISLSFGSYSTGAIGIDTSTDYTDGGKLVIKDEAKLKSAIENNFDDFKKLLIGASDKTLTANQTYIGSNKYNEDGIFTRMDSILRDYVAAPGIGKDGTYTLSGSMNIFVNKQYDYSITGFSGKNTLPDQVYSKTVSISKYEAQLKAAQTRYYAKFTALETAMNTLNSQQSQLSSMLGTS